MSYYVTDVLVGYIDLFYLLTVLDLFQIDVVMCLYVQICVGNAERASFSSSRGTSESILKLPSTSAKLLRTREYGRNDI